MEQAQVFSQDSLQIVKAASKVAKMQPEDLGNFSLIHTWFLHIPANPASVYSGASNPADHVSNNCQT